MDLPQLMTEGTLEEKGLLQQPLKMVLQRAQKLLDCVKSLPPGHCGEFAKGVLEVFTTAGAALAGS